MDNIIQVLTTVPANDENFKSNLSRATNAQIREAVNQMIDEMSKGAKHKSRINACEKEICSRNGYKTPKIPRHRKI